jgi:hypothetical protein
MPEPVFVDPRVEAEFSAKGFVKLRLFDAEETGEIRRGLERRIAGALQPNHSSIYASFLDQDESRRSAISASSAAMLQPAIARHVAGGRLRQGGLVGKAKGGGFLPIHHHTPFVDRPFDRAINCWFPLIDTSSDSGGFRVVPGSHQLLPFIPTFDRGCYFEPFRAAVESYAEDLSTEAGEAIFFETTLLHGSCANRGATDRLVMTYVLVSSEARNALILEHDGGAFFEVFETGNDPAYSIYGKTRAVLPHWRRLRHIPNRNRQITESEFVRLIERGARATEDFDPLDAVRGANDGVVENFRAPGIRRNLRALIQRVQRRAG